MKKIILTSLALIAITLNATAQNWGSKKARGNGEIVTKERAVSDFSKLKVSGSFDVVITSDRTNNISINTDENLMEYIVTEVKEGALIIKTKKYYNLRPSNHRNIKVEVPMKALELAALSGSGSIKSDETIKTESIDTKMSGSGKVNLKIDADGDVSASVAGSGKIELDVDADGTRASLSGSGRVTLSGSSKSFKVSLAGSGSIKARELAAETSDISLSGSGRIEVQVSEALKARVAGSGSVGYMAHSSTKVDSKVSGSGSVRELKY